ncbi:MAG: 1-acyl-sn-glycerol-3-phosphate acyltransferase [Treponema sp.]|jgi:1-acyl-sn-glycerol-3-phosphate acyltransferase|nr:1-acyl-sn-glycerol-3-phosphate acyltransferase [Treponema sp.]
MAKTIKTAVLFLLAGSLIILFIPTGVVCFVFSFLGLRKPMSFIIYKIAQGWARMLVKGTGCLLRVEGRGRIPKKGGVCIVSNHGSIFDIVLALAYVGRPFGFIAKKELLFIPFLNMWVYLLGGLFIDRRHPRKALATINRGIRRIRAGGGMLIFPEGHRSRGQGLLPFKSGSFRLATHSDAPVVPVSIAGSYGVFEETGLVQAVPVSLIFGEPINPKDLPPEERKQVLAEKVRDIIAGNLGFKGDGPSGDKTTASA